MPGRMNVCTASLIESMAGTLSSTSSVSSSTAPIPIAHHDSIHAYDAGNVMTSVYLAISATIRNGMYALSPAAADSPIPVNAAIIADLPRA
jgi:hypothetical protein